MKIAICSIITSSHMAYARTLAQSLFTFHPDIEFYLHIIDDNACEYTENQGTKLNIIETGKLMDQHQYLSMEKRYDLHEFIFSLKPFVIENLISQGYDKVIYFDSDIQLFNPLSNIFAELDENNILLTPHLTGPIPDDDLMPDEFSILKAGIYNLGFIGIRKSQEAVKFLQWWKQRLTYYCLNTPHQGLYVDQKWIDMVPGLFGGVKVLRDEGFNVAYWNLHQRTVIKRNNRYYIGDEDTPLIFFHFSGIDPDDKTALSKHQNRTKLVDMPGLKTMVEEYLDLLIHNRHQTFKSITYNPDNIDDNVVNADTGNNVTPESVRKIEKARHFKEFEMVIGKQYEILRVIRHPVVRIVIRLIRTLKRDKSFGDLDL